MLWPTMGLPTSAIFWMTTLKPSSYYSMLSICASMSFSDGLPENTWFFSSYLTSSVIFILLFSIFRFSAQKPNWAGSEIVAAVFLPLRFDSRKFAPYSMSGSASSPDSDAFKHF